MLRYVAPAGAPMTVTDLLRWAATAVSAGDAETRLARDLEQRFSVRHVITTSTGRAGMTLLLQAMRRLRPADRTDVILPAYTCYSVAASIVKAGLRPRIVDISPQTLDYTPGALAQLDTSRALAILTTNLYGLPNDLPLLEAYARERGLFLIDDAAQAMGAQVAGRASGTWGDAGLFSFDKGKNVSAIDGGVIVIRSDELNAAVVETMRGCSPPGSVTSLVHVAKTLVYWALLRPWLYGIPARIPQLGLGQTVFTTDYPLARPDPVLLALAATMLPKLAAFTRTRQANAAALIAELRRCDVDFIAPRADATAVYLRLPILVRDAGLQSPVIRALNAAGIGATASYPASLADVPDLQPYLAEPRAAAAGGRDVARRIVTLPTHPFLAAADVRRAGQVLLATCAGAALHGVMKDERVTP